MPNTNFNWLFKSLAMNAQSRQTEPNISGDNYYVTGAVIIMLVLLAFFGGPPRWR